jgi:hypothetical protein
MKSRLASKVNLEILMTQRAYHVQPLLTTALGQFLLVKQLGFLVASKEPPLHSHAVFRNPSSIPCPLWLHVVGILQLLLEALQLAAQFALPGHQ